MSPPEVLAEIMLMQTQRVRAHVYGSCSDKESENIDQGLSSTALEAAPSPAHSDTHAHSRHVDIM